MDDRALVEKAAAGCEASLTALIEGYYDRIHRLAWRFCGSRAAAEDIAQDVCVKLAASIRGFRFDAEFSTWVWRVTYTAAVDRLRTSRKIRTIEPSRMAALADVFATPPPITPEDALIGAELWDAVRELPPQQRDAVLLVYGEDMSHGEAAVVMGCQEKTVSWHLHEAKKRLRAVLQATG